MIEALQERLATAKNPAWYLEVFGESLERAEDVDAALRITDKLIEDQPNPPITEEDAATAAFLEALKHDCHCGGECKKCQRVKSVGAGYGIPMFVVQQFRTLLDGLWKEGLRVPSLSDNQIMSLIADLLGAAPNTGFKDMAGVAFKFYQAKAAPKHPYGAVCPRDQSGYCLPSGQASVPASRLRAAIRAELFPAKRVGKGDKARLVMADGSKPPKHIVAGKIPPAWTNVMVAKDPKSELLVTGTDAKGRRQSLYAESYTMERAAAKFSRVQELLVKKDAIFKENEKNRKNEDLQNAADCLALIMETGIRPGSEKDTKGSKTAYGATTLRSYHVVQEGGAVWLRFVGKKGVRQSHKITNPGIAAMLLARKKVADASRGQIFGVTDGQLRQYVYSLDGGQFTTKDMRTAKACEMAIAMVKEAPRPRNEKFYKKRVREICTRISHVLGNNPSQVFKSYVDPSVWTALQ